MLVTTVVLFGAARCLLSRGLPPRGAFTMLFGIVALLVSVAFDEDAEGVAAAILAGVALEVFVRSRWPSAIGKGTVAMSFGGAAVVLWLGYLGLLVVLDGIEWQAEIWLGGIALNALAAYAIAVLPSPGYQRTPSIEGDRVMRQDSTTEAVRRRYAELAQTASQGGTCCAPDEQTVFGVSRYAFEDVGTLPASAANASLGCGNPTAVADLAEGEVVLDLGSGGGIDVILSARRVGPTGKAYGLDMTDEMLDLARNNAAEAGVTNVEFLKGNIEHIPLPDASVDVVISNCVINLSTDKAAVITEAARVLRPGGRFAVSDVIADTDMDDATRQAVEEWTGCVAGALTRDDYTRLLVGAGLVDVEIRESHRVHEHASSVIVRAGKP